MTPNHSQNARLDSATPLSYAPYFPHPGLLPYSYSHPCLVWQLVAEVRHIDPTCQEDNFIVNWWAQSWWTSVSYPIQNPNSLTIYKCHLPHFSWSSLKLSSNCLYNTQLVSVMKGFFFFFFFLGTLIKRRMSESPITRAKTCFLLLPCLALAQKELGVYAKESPVLYDEKP